MFYTHNTNVTILLRTIYCIYVSRCNYNYKTHDTKDTTKVLTRKGICLSLRNSINTFLEHLMLGILSPDTDLSLTWLIILYNYLEADMIFWKVHSWLLPVTRYKTPAWFFFTIYYILYSPSHTDQCEHKYRIVSNITTNHCTHQVPYCI